MADGAYANLYYSKVQGDVKNIPRVAAHVAFQQSVVSGDVEDLARTMAHPDTCLVGRHGKEYRPRWALVMNDSYVHGLTVNVQACWALQ